MPQKGAGPSAGRAEELRAGVLWCAAGAAVSGFVPLLSGFAAAYGTCLCSAEEDRRGTLCAAAVSAAVSVLAGFLSGAGAVAECVLPVMAGFAIGLLVTKRRLGAGPVLLVAAGAAAGLMACDAYLSAQAGLSLADTLGAYYQGVADAYERSLSSSVEAQTMARTITDLMGTYWPLAYGLVGVLWCASALLGTAMFTRPGAPGNAYATKFHDCDVPLWVLVCLVAGFAVTVLAREGAALPQELVFVCANLLQAMRFVVALQGLAVVVWFLASHDIGSFGQALGVLFGIWLETQFMAMSVLGLVDGFANFRNIGRKGPRSYQNRTDESK